jgi:hypothetical protein
MIAPRKNIREIKYGSLASAASAGPGGRLACR